MLQLNGNSEKISEQLKNLPPETLQKLVEAIAIWISNNKNPQWGGETQASEINSEDAPSNY